MREDCFHLGVKALIRNREGKVLLIENERHSKQTYWDLPGGRLQRGETPIQALQREVEEEVGLKKIEGAILLCTLLTGIRIRKPDIDVGLIISVYTFNISFDFVPQLGDGHIRFCWVDIFEAIRRLEIEYPAELINLFDPCSSPKYT